MTTSTNRRGRAALGAGLASLLAGGALIATAYTANATDPYKDFEGNATTCEDVGLDGRLLISVDGADSDSNADVSGEVSGDESQYLNVELLNDDLVITGTVIKAAPAYRVYYGEPVPDMTAPLNENSGKYPTISHWFVCGTETEPSETPSETPTPTETPSETPTPTETPSETPTPTPTETGDEGGIGGDNGDDDGVGGDNGDDTGMGGDNGSDEPLPDTGAGSAGLLGAAALLALGGGLVLMSRRALGSEA
jgi:LPXTG-motif cell wall-anchored protein